MRDIDITKCKNSYYDSDDVKPDEVIYLCKTIKKAEKAEWGPKYRGRCRVTKTDDQYIDNINISQQNTKNNESDKTKNKRSDKTKHKKIDI